MRNKYEKEYKLTKSGNFVLGLGPYQGIAGVGG
jgi:hypothetical protein